MKTWERALVLVALVAALLAATTSVTMLVTELQRAQPTLSKTPAQPPSAKQVGRARGFWI